MGKGRRNSRRRKEKKLARRMKGTPVTRAEQQERESTILLGDVGCQISTGTTLEVFERNTEEACRNKHHRTS